MHNQQPITFVTKSFLISFFKKMGNNYQLIPFDQKKKMLFIEDLIFNRSTVYINMQDTKIAEYIISEQPSAAALLEDDERLFRIYFKKMTSVNLIRSCENEWGDYINKDYERIKFHSVRPNFILSHADHSLSKELEAACGIISISKDLDLKFNNIDVSVKIIEKDKEYSPKEIFTEVSQCSDVVIEDPYLLKQSYDYLKVLLENIIGRSFMLKPIHLTLVTKTGEGDMKSIPKLQADFGNSVIIEHYQSMGLHDRNIYSNTYWITSDYGFMKKYTRSSTKWTSFPIGNFFSEYHFRLSKSLGFLKREPKKSKNRLAIGFN
jgi:hypothetical protein